MAKTKSFSETITYGHAKAGGLVARSLTPIADRSSKPKANAPKALKPFSEKISTGSEFSVFKAQASQSGVFQEGMGSTWWKRAFKLFNLGYSWTEITEACALSYLGPREFEKTDRMALTELGRTGYEKFKAARKRDQKLLQIGWPELHGDPGTKVREDKKVPETKAPEMSWKMRQALEKAGLRDPGIKITPRMVREPEIKLIPSDYEGGETFRFAVNNKKVLPNAPEVGSESRAGAFRVAVDRIKGSRLGATDGDIGAAIKLFWNRGGYDLSPTQKKILQTGWPHLVGPPGQDIEVKYYANPGVNISAIKNNYAKPVSPEYKELRTLQSMGFFEMSKEEKAQIIKERRLNYVGYYLPLTTEEKEVLVSKGYTPDQAKKISARANRRPEEGYTRHRDPRKFAVGSWERQLISWIGFIDLDSRGLPHEMFPTGIAGPTTATTALKVTMPIRAAEVVNPRIPRGNNYHSSIGWY